MKRKPIILASASPRRSRILNEAGIDHEIIVSHAHEICEPDKGPEYNVRENSRIKARAIAETKQDRIIIGSDTIVYFEEEILGKPLTISEAEKTLFSYSEKSLEVYSGVCVINQETKKTAVGVCKTILHVRKMTKRLVHEICETLDPLDRAGSFSIEGAGAYLFDNIEGSFYNVLGLPLNTLYDTAEKTGLDLLLA